MAQTSPDGIWSPDSGDDYALTTDLASMSQTVQDAITKRSGHYGTTSQRNSFTLQAQPGVTWWDSNENALFVFSGGTWLRVAPEEDTGWINLTPMSSFSANPNDPPRVKRKGDTVYLAGDFFRSSAPTSNEQAAQLPSGLFPLGTVATVTTVFGSAGNQPTRVSVTSSGAVRISSETSRTSGPGYTITGINFPRS